MPWDNLKDSGDGRVSGLFWSVSELVVICADGGWMPFPGWGRCVTAHFFCDGRSELGFLFTVSLSREWVLWWQLPYGLWHFALSVTNYLAGHHISFL